MSRNRIYYLLCLLAAAFSLFSGLRDEYFVVRLICPLAIVIAGFIFYDSNKDKEVFNEKMETTLESLLINGFGGGLLAITFTSPSPWKITIPLFLLLVGFSVYWQKRD